MATALLVREPHLRVLVVEQGDVCGRHQEWNTSRAELNTLRALGVATADELDAAVASEFNPMRIGFTEEALARAPSPSVFYVDGVLNIGVSPRQLVATVRRRFEQCGGHILEQTRFLAAEVQRDAVEVSLSVAAAAASSSTAKREVVALGAGSTQARPWSAAESDQQQQQQQQQHNRPGTSATDTASPAEPRRRQQVRARLLIDCMGNASPIARQHRELVYGQRRPASVCVVVGSCCRAERGIDPFAGNTSGDLLFAFTRASGDRQYFWEAFPSDGGACRTTYLFTYVDVDERRDMTLREMFVDYLRLLPEYQNLKGAGGAEVIARLRPLRALFGFFPAYAEHAPLPPAFDRVMAIGDASGVQSPLSFGGFGAMLRHLPRLTAAVSEALAVNTLSAAHLRAIHAYLPSLSVTWLFQRAMSYRVGQMPLRPPTGAKDAATAAVVNDILCTNFSVMSRDPRILRPFLMDVVQFGGLTRALLLVTLLHGGIVPRILGHVGGVQPLWQWLGNYLALLQYTLASRWVGEPTAVHRAIERLLPSAEARYLWHRQREAWLWGSGRDHRA